MFTLTMLAASSLAAPQTFDISFDGGTVTQWVDAIKAQAPQANIYVSGGIPDAVAVGEMHFNDVTVDAVMQIANEIPGSPVHSNVIHGEGAPVWVVWAEPAREDAQYARRAGQPREARSSSRNETDVISVPDEYRTDRGMARLGEILTTVSTLDGDTPMTVRFIKGTDLVVLHGGSRQLETAQAIITMLRQPGVKLPAAEARRSTIASHVQACRSVPRDHDAPKGDLIGILTDAG